jgi:hypothetical protein
MEQAWNGLHLVATAAIAGAAASTDSDDNDDAKNVSWVAQSL